MKYKPQNTHTRTICISNLDKVAQKPLKQVYEYVVYRKGLHEEEYQPDLFFSKGQRFPTEKLCQRYVDGLQQAHKAIQFKAYRVCSTKKQ